MHETTLIPGGWFTRELVTVTGSSVYTDAGTAVVTASGTGVEAAAYSDASAGSTTASGTRVESWLTAYDAVVEADNPTSHWKLGTTGIAVDRKGVRDQPAVNGPIATSAGLVINNAGELANTFVASSSQVFTVPAVADGRGLPYDGPAVTIEAWIKPTTLSVALVCSRSGHAELQTEANGTVRLSVTVDGVPHSVDSAAGSIVAGGLYHLAATYDGATAIIYRNGAEIKRLALAGSVLSQPGDVPAIGARRDGVSPFDGVIDEVAWYNTALSAARVAAHVQAGSASVYFDSGAGTVTASGTGVESYDTGSGSAPVATIVSTTRTKISRVAPFDATDVVWSADSAFAGYQFRVVPSSADPVTQGALIEQDQSPAAGGTATTQYTSTITDAEVEAVSPAEGAKIVKLFVRNGTGTWSV